MRSVLLPREVREGSIKRKEKQQREKKDEKKKKIKTAYDEVSIVASRDR